MIDNNTDSLAFNTGAYKDLNTIPHTSVPNISTETNGIYHIGMYISEKETIVKQERKNENFPVSVFDVASYILKKLGKSCSTMKLHKLLYYSQAWSMVWDERPIFSQKIEAWANGPVVRTLFNFHKGMYDISYSKFSIGDERNLSAEQKETVDAVLKFYGDKTAQWLINQSHFEKPWREARVGMEPDERGNNVISLDSMYEYYSSLG